MSSEQFWFVYLTVLATMLFCRVVPLFVLKGRDLSPAVREAIGLIPASAFAALVANDLFSPDAFAASTIEGLVPVLAALPVIVVARHKSSLLLCAVVGMLSYAVVVSLAGLF